MDFKKIYYIENIITIMAIKKNFSLAIVDIEKIEEINQIVIKYSKDLSQYSIHAYFNLSPIRNEDVYMDLVLFKLESEKESDLEKTLNELIEELNQLNTQYSIRDEDTQDVIVEIEYVTSLNIKFDNVKSIKKGTYAMIDGMNHLKTEFGICKTYNPNFRPIEEVSVENTLVEPEIIYVFSDSAENFSKLKTFVREKILEFDSNLIIEEMPFQFID